MPHDMKLCVIGIKFRSDLWLMIGANESIVVSVGRDDFSRQCRFG